MAHYAYIDENNIVTNVIVGPDEGTEPEGIDSWEAYFSSKGKGKALRTSYNTYENAHINGGEPFRKNFAGIGFSYDEENDAFIAPQPFPSWTLNAETFVWDPPVPAPEDGQAYDWDEESLSWVLVS
jgi:hypothetical protein